MSTTLGFRCDTMAHDKMIGIRGGRRIGEEILQEPWGLPWVALNKILKFQYSLALRHGRCADRRLEFDCFPADEKVPSQRSVSLPKGKAS